MKKISFLIFFFFFNLINANANEGVFFLDIDYLVNNSNSGKVIIKKLQDLNSKNNKILNQEELEIKSLETEITNQKNIISKDELKNKIENLKKKVSSYRLNKKQISKEFDNFKKNELEIFFKEITPIIEEFMDIKSIKIILDKKKIFIADSNYDITNELIQFLNDKLK